MSLITQDGIADVVKMRHNSIIKQKRILYLAGVSDNAVVPDNDAFTNIGVMPNLTIAANNDRPFYHRPIFDQRAFANKDIVTDKSDPFTAIVQPGMQISLQVSCQLR